LAGVVWRAEGVLAAAQHRFQESEAYFDKAIKVCKQYTLPWDEADTLHCFGRAMLDSGQLDRANEKLKAAIRIYTDLGAQGSWHDRVETDQRRAKHSHIEPGVSIGLATREPTVEEASFSNKSDFWTISYRGRTFQLKDMRGLHYLAYLLGHPNERFHVCDLVAVFDGESDSTGVTAKKSSTAVYGIRPDGAVAPVLDAKAKAEYRARLSELRAEIDDAEQMNDPGRAERARREFAFLNKELSVALGLGGRDRKLSDYGERARQRVGKAIRSAVGVIQKSDRSLAHHFSTCIRTGYYCGYTPDPHQQWSWKL
jgi:tetratricopeptide (TPR) repeat protein